MRTDDILYCTNCGDRVETIVTLEEGILKPGTFACSCTRYDDLEKGCIFRLERVPDEWTVDKVGDDLIEKV